MHSPKSSRERRPSRESLLKRSSTRRQRSVGSPQLPLVVWLMNFSPFNARFAPERVRARRAWARRASRAAAMAEKSLAEAEAEERRGDGDRSQENFRRILDVVEELRLRVGVVSGGTVATLRSTMESWSSSSITSTRSEPSEERNTGAMPSSSDSWSSARMSMIRRWPKDRRELLPIDGVRISISLRDCFLSLSLSLSQFLNLFRVL